MANFNTHLTFAAAGSSLIGTLALKIGYVDIADALLMTLAGTTGGILPDIDLKYSYPSKLMFSLLGTLSALLWVFSTKQPWSILELWAVGLVVYLAVRYPVWFLFHKMAVHRGSIHSVVAALLSAFLTSLLCHQLLSKPPFICWLIAFAMFAGYILHLVLDEIYSVDFMNVRVKRSFGSALKLMDTKHVAGTCTLLILCMVSWFYTPSATEFVRTFQQHETQTDLYNRLLPLWLLERLDKR